MPDRIRLALVGCGGFSHERAQKAIADSDLLQVVACYDPDASAARQAAERFGARSCSSYEEAIAADGIEAAVLLTPNHVHRDQAVAAFQKGLHVFVEKPMANTVAEGLDMIRAADQAGCVLMVGHQTRRLPAFRRLRQMLGEGRLGTPVSAEAQFSHDGGKHLPPGAWRGDPRRCPGLPLNVIGVHLVDVLNMLFGRPRSVAALHSRALVPGNVDCTATLVGYDPPLSATVVSNYCTPTVHSVRVVGTEAVVEIRQGAGVLAIREGQSKTEHEETFGPVGLAGEYDVFARGIRNGEPVETDGRSSLLAVAVTEASVISAREHRFVRIDDLLEGL